MLNKHNLFAVPIRAQLSLVIFVAFLCGRASADRAANDLPLPQSKDTAAATVEVTPPPDNVGRHIFAGLKRDGRIVALGEAEVPPTGNVTVSIQAIQSMQDLPDRAQQLRVR